MDGRVGRLYFAGALSFVLVSAHISGQDWERANAEVRRLDPSAFPQLPTAISSYLRQRGCGVPQVFGADRPGGVIQGRFTSNTQVDWAVLCSVRRLSSILVFRGGSIARVDDLARLEDSTFLQVVGRENVVGYSRTIRVATPARIRSHSGNSTGVRVDHDGIEDAFVGKGSTLWYWDDGRWRELPGAD